MNRAFRLCRRLLMMAAVLAVGSVDAFEVVVIDPGHGGKDPGSSWNGLTEKNLCLDVAKRLQRVLEDQGMKAVLTRSSDTYVELSDRAAISNRHSNAVFVSIHFNACKDRSIAGFEVHHRSKSGLTLAHSISEAVCKAVNCKRRDGDWEDYKVLRQTKATAVLVECGFISNKAEAGRCGDPDHRQALAKGIANGILAVKTKL